jgi:hypothetical protein
MCSRYRHLRIHFTAMMYCEHASSFTIVISFDSIDRLGIVQILDMPSTSVNMTPSSTAGVVNLGQSVKQKTLPEHYDGEGKLRAPYQR